MGNKGKNMRLNGKTAIVTGGASGFGAGIVRKFAQEGARVAVVDINEEAAVQIASDVDGIALMADVGDAASVAEMARAATSAFETIDIVVNNAGWTHHNKPMLDVTEEEYDRLYDINVRSIFHMSRAVVPIMRTQGAGVILNIGSTAGIRPRPGLTWYNSTKGAVNLLSKSMAVELAPDGIRVNCIAPVIGATALLESFMGLPDTPENREKFIATIPMGRMSEPQDIANACLYLASNEAEFITGIVLEVDGGRTI